MNTLFLSFISLLSIIQLQAQNIKFGASISLIRDYDWNKPFRDFEDESVLKNTQIQSFTPFCISLIIEKEQSVISPSIGINLIHRNLNYYNNFTLVSRLAHRSIELPLNFTKRKILNKDASILLYFGGGLSYIMSPSKMAFEKITISDSLIYIFDLINSSKLNGFINAGIGIENKIGNAGRLQIKFLFVYYINTNVSYLNYNLGLVQTSPFRINHASVGLSFFPSFLKKIRPINQI